MVGLGFELKKIYKRTQFLNVPKGIGYSSVIIVAPMLIMITVILITYKVLEAMGVSIWERELLSSTILYSFVFGIIVTTPINTVWSRYITDKIFLQKPEDIQPAYYTGLLLACLIGAISGAPFAIRLYIVNDLSIFFVLSCYSLFMCVLIVFYSMVFIASIRNYRLIAIQCLGGMLLSLVVGFVLIDVMEVKAIEGILYGLNIGFIYIAANEFAYICKRFSKNSGNYKECVRYILKHKGLFLSGLLFALGIFAHNLVMWTSRLGIVVADILVTAPSYDMATHYALLTNIFLMFIFMVNIKRNFQERYQVYLDAAMHSTLDRIEKAKNDMFHHLVKQLRQLIQLQTIISCVLFLISIIFLPMIGVSGIILHIYPTLAVAYFVIFPMYCNIILLYYFNDNKGAILVSGSFLVSVLLGTIVLSKISISYYGVGTLIGALIGWSVSFFRIRYLEMNFDKYVFMQGCILPIKRKNVPSQIVYMKGDSFE